MRSWRILRRKGGAFLGGPAALAAALALLLAAAPLRAAEAAGDGVFLADIDAAEDAFAETRPPSLAVGAAESVGGMLWNAVFFPLRVVVGSAGAFVGGVAGAMSGGDERAAAGIWNVTTDGSYFLTPETMEGRRSIRLTGDHP